jgi:nucleoid-associated protein YgaU
VKLRQRNAMKPSKLGLLGWFLIALFGMGAGFLVLVLLASLYSVQGTPPPTEEIASRTLSIEPQVEDEAQQGTVSQEQPAQEDSQEPAQPPVFSDVRVEADGLAVIAGRAAPQQGIILYVDGQEAARTKADAAGAFALVTFLPASRQAQILTLAGIDAAGAKVSSLDEVILAPRSAPPEPAVDVVASLEVPNASELGDAPRHSAVSDSSLRESARTIAPSEPPAPERVTSPVLVGDSIGGNAPPEVAGELEPTPAKPAQDQVSASSDKQMGDTEETREAAASISPGRAQSPVLAEAEPKVALSSGPSDREPPESHSSARIVLKSNEEGVRLLQPPSPAPDIMSQVSLDTIGYSNGGDVQLTGRAQSDAALVQVYLNNAPIAALPVDTSGAWRAHLPNVDTGIYTLRIDEMGADGMVTSRIETPFKRESPEVLEAAALQRNTPVASITVQAGNTLWAIARERYGEGTFYLRVFEANKDAIKDPNLIYPGQVFTLPQE